MDKLEKLNLDLTTLDGQIDQLIAAGEEAGSFDDEQKQQHAALSEKRKAMVAAIAAEEDRLEREEQRRQVAERTEARRLQQEARAERERRTRLASGQRDDNRQSDTAVITPGSTRMTDAQLPNPADTPSEHGDQLQRQNRPRRTWSIPAQARRTGPIKNFQGNRRMASGDVYDAEERAYRFGMWALAKLQRELPGRFDFQASVDFVKKHMAVTEADASGYHYLIPEEFGADIIVLRERYGVARRLLKHVPMTTDTRMDPRRKGGLTAYFVGEGQAGTESNKLWDNVRLTAKEIMVLSRYTGQINADSVINIGDDLAGEIVYAYSLTEDNCAFLGDGTSTYGQIVGVAQKLINPANDGNASAGLIVSASGHNSWTTLTLSDFHGVVGILPQYADTDEATWVCHRSFYFNVMQRLELASGGVPAREVQWGGGGPGGEGVMKRGRPLFLGYPVEFSQVMPSTTGASPQVPVYLGDFNLGASFGDRQLDSIAFSEHATIGGQNVFERNQIAIRGIERIDINIHDAGTNSTPGPICGLQMHS